MEVNDQEKYENIKVTRFDFHKNETKETIAPTQDFIYFLLNFPTEERKDETIDEKAPLKEGVFDIVIIKKGEKPITLKPKGMSKENYTIEIQKGLNGLLNGNVDSIIFFISFAKRNIYRKYVLVKKQSYLF